MTVDLVQEQIKLEDEYVSQAVAKYKAEYLEAKKKKGVDHLTPEQLLIRKAVEPLVEEICQFVVRSSSGTSSYRGLARCVLTEMDAWEVAYITCRYVMQTMFNVRGRRGIYQHAQAHALKLADELRFHYCYTLFKAKYPALTAKIHEHLQGLGDHLRHKKRVFGMNIADKLDEEEVREWIDEERLHLGMFLLQAFSTCTGFIKFTTVQKNRKSLPIFTPTPEIQEWLDAAHDRASLFSAPFPPMVSPPVSWTTLFDGGYYTNQYTQRTMLIHTYHVKKEREKYQLPKVVYDVANTVQEIPWQVNQRIAGVLEDLRKAGGGRAKLPDLDKQILLPQKPWATDEEFKQWKEERPEEVREYCVEASNVYREWVRNTSKREMLYQKCMFGKRFAKYEKLYMVPFFDWRGRVYYLGNVTPQGDDASKALLQFAQPKPVDTDDALYWLAVHGANCAGQDKLSYDERVRFIEENTNDIRRCAQDPMQYQWWLDVAGDEDPLQFLSFCFAWNDIHNGEKDCHIPVQLDGTCNGLQHYAALLRDPSGAALVNLSKSLEKPEDIYVQVADIVAKEVVRDAREGHEVARKWVGKVTRKIVKRNVMTLVYGVTPYGMAQQIEEEVEKQHIFQPNEIRQACVYLAGKVQEAIDTITTAASHGMAWLQELGRVGAACGSILEWHSPLGFPVRQAYYRTKSKRVKTFYGGTEVRLRLKQDIPNTVDSRRTVNGVAPNFVHSMDATHLMMVVIQSKQEGITDLSLVHDSFGTHARDIPQFNRIIREQFVELYTPDRMAEFEEQLRAQLPPDVVMPPRPELGSFDLNEVLTAPYFFS